MILSSYMAVPPFPPGQIRCAAHKKKGPDPQRGLRAGPRAAPERCGRLRRVTVREQRRRMSGDPVSPRGDPLLIVRISDFGSGSVAEDAQPVSSWSGEMKR